MNKLADRIAKEKLTKYSDGHYTQFNGHENILMAMAEAMQAYHEAKMKEVTDEDIEEHFLKSAWAINKHGEITPRIRHYIEGAKAAFNGEIKHIEP